MGKQYVNAIIDGMISASIMVLLGLYCTSTLISLDSLVSEIIVILLCITISCISASCNLRCQSIQIILKSYIISFISCILFCIALLVMINFIDLEDVFLQRKLNNADGILILFAQGIYLCSTLVFRVVWLIIQVIRIRTIK